MSFALCATETVQQSESNFLPVFEGELRGLGKITLLSTVHFEPDPYSFDKEEFDLFTSLMVEHDCGKDQEEGISNLVESVKSYELVSLQKGFWGDWYQSLPLSPLQKINLSELLEENKGLFLKWFETPECEFSQIHPFVFRKLWDDKILKEARTLKTFEETIDGRILRIKENHNKRVAYLESWELSFEEFYGPELKHFTRIMRDPNGSQQDVIALLENLNHSFEEKIQEYREGIADMYRSLFSQDWKQIRKNTLDKRDEAFATSIIREMKASKGNANEFATFGYIHTRGVIKRLQNEGLLFAQLKDDGSRIIIEQLVD